MAIIGVDYENNSEWWNCARAAADPVAPPEIELILEVGWPDAIEVDNETAERLLAWCKLWDGWESEDAPEYAPNPLLFIWD